MVIGSLISVSPVHTAGLLKDNSIFMLVYKCDGDSYTTGKKCTSEAKDELPTRWLLISGKIKNGLYDAHYIEANGTRHFCSRRCLENFLFKDVNPAQGQGPLNTMNIDPKEEEVKQPADAVAPVEQATEDSEEVTEG